MYEKIKLSLAENFRNDETVLNDLIDEITAIALSISNRARTEDNIKILEPYIRQCVIGDYLNRGAEGYNSLNEGGRSEGFKNNRETMRQNIIRDGLRVIY